MPGKGANAYLKVAIMKLTRLGHCGDWWKASQLGRQLKNA